MVVIAGAVLATAGTAHAQTSVAAPGITGPTAAAGVPWYQQFTTSTGLTESITGAQEDDRLPQPTWALSQRWGVTVDVREAARIERAPDGGRGDQTAVGAFYQFTPAVRVGGEVSVETARRPGAAAAPRRPNDDEPAAGVRLESAFRF
jgi:hypothetical protein